MNRRKLRNKKTRYYQLLILAKIAADITIIIGFGIIAFLLARKYIFG